MKKNILKSPGAAFLGAVLCMFFFTSCPPDKKLVSTVRVVKLVANPAKIKANATSTITATVINKETYDSGQVVNQPVKGVEVTFDVTGDCGTLSAHKDTTDDNGYAQVTFTPSPGVVPPCKSTITATDDTKTSNTCTVTVI